MKLFKCHHREDKRDQWYEMQLGNGNKMGIVYRGQGQMEFWGGRLSENADRILLLDTDNDLETLFDRIHTVCVAAIGKKEYEAQTAPTPLWFAIAELMSVMKGMQERTPGLQAFRDHFGHERDFREYVEQFNKQMSEAKAASEIKIIVTASGENATHTAEMGS